MQQNMGGPMGAGSGPGETRNLILAIAISAAILIGWTYFYELPHRARLQAEQARIEGSGAPAAASAVEPGAPTAAPVALGRAQALAQNPRAAIDTGALAGSISLEGARFDDLALSAYRVAVSPDSDPVTLLSPFAGPHGYDAFFGWQDSDPQAHGVLDRDVWRAGEGARLTPQTPLVLNFSSGDGLEFTRTISVDEGFMFTIADQVRNTGAGARELRPYGVVRRLGKPADFVNSSIVHQGFAGAFGPNNHLNVSTYQQADKHARERASGRIGDEQKLTEQQGRGGWLGITDHYWLAALIPDQGEAVSAYFDSRAEGAQNDYRAAYRGAWRALAPGGSVTYTQRLFAGAKVVDTLRAYQRDLAIPKFDEAVDWGNLMWPLTRPFFLWLVHPLAKFAGNFGLGILLTTIVVRLLLFPLVYQSFSAMAKMRAIQPKMKEIQERYAADKPRQQQEILKLYQSEKINPVAGCVPILFQIPVFFALYKTLSVTIEMRHAPFFGWIRDLSAPDPTNLFNLFGLLPYDPHTLPLIGTFLALGLWPVFYGLTMWALQSLSPPPADPVQAAMMRYFPLVFTFMFAGFPAGLVIYWTWSNVLSILQQYVIMRRQGVETQLDTFLKKRFERNAAG